MLKTLAFLPLLLVPFFSDAAGRKPLPDPAPWEVPGPIRLARTALAVAPGEDRDGDCLSDEAEHALATHFRPLFIFDSRENRRNPDEPVVIYRVQARQKYGSCALPFRGVEIRYAFLFVEDGGFAASPLCSRIWSTAHPGDNESVSVTLESDASGRLFSVREMDVGNSHWPNEQVFIHDGSHPIVYLSAGKHHAYANQDMDGALYPDPSFGCREGVDARGTRVLAVLESPHSPRGRSNVGERDIHDSRYFVVDLGRLGFPGESAWGETPFCGGSPQGCKGTVTSSMSHLWGD